MKYSRTIAGGIAGTILLVFLLAGIVLIHIERVEFAAWQAWDNESEWFQDGGETEGYDVDLIDEADR